MHCRPALIAVLAGALLGAPALAQAGEWGGLFPGVIAASDYRYQGASLSSGEPVAQGYLHWWRADGFYAGVFATQVDMGGFPGAPSYELDLYAGKTLMLQDGRTELKLEAMYTAYPDNRTWGPTMDFGQVKAQATRRYGAWTVGAAAAYTPQSSYGSGPLVRGEAMADYRLNDRIKLKAMLGRQGEGRGHDRSYWSVGAEAKWKSLTFDLRYVGTDRSRAGCGFQPDVCGAALVGAVTWALPGIL